MSLGGPPEQIPRILRHGMGLSWKDFLRRQASSIVACDFLTVDTLLPPPAGPSSSPSAPLAFSSLPAGAWPRTYSTSWPSAPFGNLGRGPGHAPSGHCQGHDPANDCPPQEHIYHRHGALVGHLAKVGNDGGEQVGHCQEDEPRQGLSPLRRPAPGWCSSPEHRCSSVQQTCSKNRETVSIRVQLCPTEKGL